LLRYANRKQGGRHIPNVRRLLKYIQFRYDRDDHMPDADGPAERWVDGGLGDRYQDILTRLDELSPGNRHAYCHAIVISPDPEALAAWQEHQATVDAEREDIQPLVGDLRSSEGDLRPPDGDLRPSGEDLRPPDGDLRHVRFVKAVQDTLADWEEWRQERDQKPQIGPIEYSFVVHRPERDYGEQMHAHVIVAAATQDSMTGEYTPFYNNGREIEAFKEIAYRQLDRVFELERVRELPEPERAPEGLKGIVPEREIEFFSFFETQSTRGNEYDPQPSLEIE